jgi:intracellular sulfur oxidation DsrE/DsrF family protein
MKEALKRFGRFNGMRRRLLSTLVAGGGFAALGATRNSRAAAADELRFPGDPAEHKLVYQLNKGEPGYHAHILFSVGAVLRSYGDNVQVVVTCFAEGIHVLAKEPLRPVAEQVQERVRSLAHNGVELHACRNTMKSLNWTEADLVPFAKVVEVGAADLMELQEQGFAYISW